MGTTVPDILKNYSGLFLSIPAKNRYRWLGKTKECRVPTAELKARSPD